MNSQEATDKLTRKGIKPTANRILVYKALLSHSAPMSLGDMENLMPSMDKSSIFRTLTLFLEHDVVHAFVPYAMLHPLYDAKERGRKAIFIAKGSEHAMAYRDHHEEYTRVVKDVPALFLSGRHPYSKF